MAASSSNGSINTNRRARPRLRSRCDCGDLVGKWTSWTDLNPGRRFVGCPNFQDREKDCDYFDWVDPLFPNQWYKDLILQVHNHNNGGGIDNEHFGDFVEQAPETVGMQQGCAAVEGDVFWKKICFGFLVLMVFYFYM
ncbi:hypothetical protein LXL04_035274 [Taraxacum kok-saghyz]